MDTELPVGYLGAVRMALPEHAEKGDRVGAALSLHGIGYRRVGLELVPRRDLALAETVLVEGRPCEKLTPGKTLLAPMDSHRLHLAEDEPAAAPHDEVDLVAAGPDVAAEHAVAAQAVVDDGAPLGSPPRGASATPRADS